MNNTNKEILTCLLDDEKFINKIKSQIDKVMEDDKLDVSDLVSIITLIIEIAKNKDIFLKIDKKDIAEVFRCLLVNIFIQLEIYRKLKSKSNLDDNVIQKKVDSIIEDLITILVTKVKTISFFKKYFKKITCCCK